ncbi:hypothetical protein LOAG_10663, partial [Loa loa]
MDHLDRGMYRFRIAYTTMLILIVIMINYALFSPNWRNLVLSDNYDLIDTNDNNTITNSVTMRMNNDAINIPRFSNEPKLIIPRQMGILRNRCSYKIDTDDQFTVDDIMLDENDMIKANWSMEMELNDNNSIPINTCNPFMQMNNTNEFCLIWSLRPISDNIVMILILSTSLLDLLALVTPLIYYDGQHIGRMPSVTFLFQINLILALSLTTAIILYACCNGQAI